MHILFIVGRILLVLIFIAAGAQKLMDLQGTASYIAPHVTVPDALAGVAAQIQDATGMTVPYLMSLGAGILELVAGLLIAFNIATRGAAALLAIFAFVTIFYFHDFWNMAGADRENNMIHALKNLSIVGGLLVFVVIGSWRPVTRTDQV
jgi:uncharacterized membrane protein YphA (DoxX/SURF4 family)